MIGLVIVTHGHLAEEFRRALEHVVGPQRNVATVCIAAEDDTETCRAEVRRRVEEVDAGDGVILLTDMFGGTPSNTCIAQMARPGVEVLGGVSLPLLVKLAKVRSTLALSDAVSVAQAAGRKYMACASDVLPYCKGHDGAALPSSTLNGPSANGPHVNGSALNGGPTNGVDRNGSPVVAAPMPRPTAVTGGRALPFGPVWPAELGGRPLT